jgi:hypothetical protein
MQSLSKSGLLTFRVTEEDAGGYSAVARVGDYSMVTQGDDLDELRRMIQDLVEDFNAHEDGQIKCIALQFSASRVPLAA